MIKILIQLLPVIDFYKCLNILLLALIMSAVTIISNKCKYDIPVIVMFEEMTIHIGAGSSGHKTNILVTRC